MELISVVLPSYNVASYLDRCLLSILNQTYTNLEVIAIDDGSTDNTWDILQKYKERDKRVKIIHQNNKGPSTARNVGIDESTGKYVCFIDTDDYIDPTYIEKLYNAIKINDSDISICDYYLINGSEISFDKTKYLINEQINGYTYLQRLYTPNRTKYIVSWGKMYKKTSIGKFVEDRKYTDDQTFSFETCFSADKISIIPDRLYFYAYNPNSIMNSKKNFVKKQMINSYIYRSTILDSKDERYSEIKEMNYEDMLSSYIDYKKAGLKDIKLEKEFKKVFFKHKSNINIKNILKCYLWRIYVLCYK